MSEKCSDVSGIRRLQNTDGCALGQTLVFAKKCRDISAQNTTTFLASADYRTGIWGALGHPWGLMGRLLHPSAKGLLPFHKVLEEFDSRTEKQQKVDALSES